MTDDEDTKIPRIERALEDLINFWGWRPSPEQIKRFRDIKKRPDDPSKDGATQSTVSKTGRKIRTHCPKCGSPKISVYTYNARCFVCKKVFGNLEPIIGPLAQRQNQNVTKNK